MLQYLYSWIGGLCGWTVERSLAIQKVAGSNLGRSAAKLQPWASCSHACASVTKQYNLVPANGRWRSSAGKVTAGLAESNDSLPPGGWLQVTRGLTACTPGLAPGPTLGNEYGRTLTFTFIREFTANVDTLSIIPRKILCVFPWIGVVPNDGADDRDLCFAAESGVRCQHEHSPIVDGFDDGRLSSSATAAEVQRVGWSTNCQTHRPAVTPTVSILFRSVQRHLLDYIRHYRKPCLTVWQSAVVISR